MPIRRPSARAAACISRSSSYPMVSQAPFQAPRERGPVPHQAGRRAVRELAVAHEGSAGGCPSDPCRAGGRPCRGAAPSRTRRGGVPPPGRPRSGAWASRRLAPGRGSRAPGRVRRGSSRPAPARPRRSTDRRSRPPRPRRSRPAGPRIRPALVDSQLRPDHLVERLGGGHEVLAAVARPLDGLPEPASEERDQHLLAVERDLGSEAAAHVRRDYPEAMSGQVEQLRERVADDPRDLGARVQGEPAPAFVVLRKIAAVLDRGRGLPAHPEAARDPHRRPREGCLGVAARELPVDDHVAREVLVEAGASGARAASGSVAAGRGS